MSRKRVRAYVDVPHPAGGGRVLAQVLQGPASLRVRATNVVRDHLESLGLTMEGRESGMPVFEVPAVLVDAAVDPWHEAFSFVLPELRLLRALGLRHLDQRDLRQEVLPHLGSSCTSAEPRSVPEGDQLFPFQRAGLEWLRLSSWRAILGDEMGLGKTPTALVAAHEAGAWRTLVVTTTSTLRNWVKEARRWHPSAFFHACGSSKQISEHLRHLDKQRERRGVVVTWGLLDRNAELLSAVPWDFVIVDEAHYAKELTSQRTRALLPLVLSSPARLMLTGTDVPNRPREIWPLLHMVDPARYPVFRPFGERYCQPVERALPGGSKVIEYNGAMNLKDLARELRGLRVRRLKVDVLEQLPDKTHQTLELDEVPEISEAFKRWRAETAKLMAVNRSLDLGPHTPDLSALGRFRLDAGMTKVDDAVEWLLNAVSPTDPAVAFIWHRDVHDELVLKLREAGLRVDSIVGATTSKRRDELVSTFQAGGLDVLVGSSAMKEGVTLTRSRLCLRVERWWTLGDEAQAEDRVFRIGQTRGVLVTNLHLPGSTDDYVVKLLDKKAAWIDQLGGKSFKELLLADLARGDRDVQP